MKGKKENNIRDEKIEGEEREKSEKYKKRELRWCKRERERWKRIREQEELGKVIQGCRKHVSG